MGFMANQYWIEHQGHTIEVEATSSFSGNTFYSLFVDDERVDRAEATLGAFTLRGTLASAGSASAKPMVIRMTAGLFSDRCMLEVDGDSIRVPRRR